MQHRHAVVAAAPRQCSPAWCWRSRGLCLVPLGWRPAGLLRRPPDRPLGAPKAAWRPTSAACAAAAGPPLPAVAACWPGRRADAGAAAQPRADPYVLGISGGAAAGALGAIPAGAVAGWIDAGVFYRRPPEPPCWSSAGPTGAGPGPDPSPSSPASSSPPAAARRWPDVSSGPGGRQRHAVSG